MCDVIHAIYMMMIMKESILPVEEKKYDEGKGGRFIHMQKDKKYICGGEEERTQKEEKENIQSAEKKNEKEKGGMYTFLWRTRENEKKDNFWRWKVNADEDDRQTSG